MTMYSSLIYIENFDFPYVIVVPEGISVGKNMGCYGILWDTNDIVLNGSPHEPFFECL